MALKPRFYPLAALIHGNQPLHLHTIEPVVITAPRMIGRLAVARELLNNASEEVQRRDDRSAEGSTL
ncbi:hypothetical protein [Rhizobium sp. No.120]